MAKPPFKKLSDLLGSISGWLTSYIPYARLSNDRPGRVWFTQGIEYTGTFKLKDLRAVTDRGELNSEYVERYKNTSPKSRKGVSALKVEISALYSFNKCFVQRYKGRMHFYRDDLIQKGSRNSASVGTGLGLFSTFKSNLD